MYHRLTKSFPILKSARSTTSLALITSFEAVQLPHQVVVRELEEEALEARRSELAGCRVVSRLEACLGVEVHGRSTSRPDQGEQVVEEAGSDSVLPTIFSRTSPRPVGAWVGCPVWAEVPAWTTTTTRCSPC